MNTNNEKKTTDDLSKVEGYVSYSPATLEDDLKRMDFDYFNTSVSRDNLLEKLTPLVMDMRIDTNVCDKESAAALDSQMSVVNTYMSLLNDKEKSIKQKIEIKTKQRELIDAGKKTDAFIEALDIITKKHSENFIKSKVTQADSELQNRISEENITVSEQELRDDPTDLS